MSDIDNLGILTELMWQTDSRGDVTGSWMRIKRASLEYRQLGLRRSTTVIVFCRHRTLHSAQFYLALPALAHCPILKLRGEDRPGQRLRLQDKAHPRAGSLCSAIEVYPTRTNE